MKNLAIMVVNIGTVNTNKPSKAGGKTHRQGHPIKHQWLIEGATLVRGNSHEVADMKMWKFSYNGLKTQASM